MLMQLFCFACALRSRSSRERLLTWVKSHVNSGLRADKEDSSETAGGRGVQGEGGEQRRPLIGREEDDANYFTDVG